MPSLCCFWCPAKDFKERAAGECCPTCGRVYEMPLQALPSFVGGFRVVEPVSRGFYSVVYRAQQESLQRVVVLKVVPVGVYEFFGKNWKSECQAHAKIAEGTSIVANITDQFNADVDFGDTTLPCHVAVLENIAGPTLYRLVTGESGEFGLTPRMAAQIAVDLFEILHLFTQRECFHNDLHAGNIIVQRLTGQPLRSDAIDPMVRAVAIDLGSMLDQSRSDSERVGDQHHIARHISALAKAVHAQGGSGNDVDYRLAGALRGLAEHLTPDADAQRLMTIEDASKTLRAAMAAVDEPWRQPLSLQRFGDAYNAQALESWHVPELWFDPENKWLAKTTVRGPQVITGMRGCGKTMLLRALHFHARAARATSHLGANESTAELAKDDFIGVYASCQKLLDPLDHGGDTVAVPFERLFVAYLRDGIQVLRHLRSIDSEALLGGIDLLLRDALIPLELAGEAIPPSGEQAFEQFLIDLQFRLADGSVGCQLKMAPAEAFGHLAVVLRGAAPALAGKYILFLLDDVSTRYLKPEMVRGVISKLLFQHPHCAFRITTEAQALHRVLLSPGGSAPADPGRDYEEFDLGNEVYRLLKEGSTSRNMEFVGEILRRRGRQFRDELYRRDPIDILGDDLNLEDIAREIATSSATSPARKRVYRGLRALQAVCVGDLGDVVKLYEKILHWASLDKLPVSAEKQSDCYLEHSASLLHFLNRRDQHKKGLALAFAQAAGELLQRSARNGGSGRRQRLRQYTKLYVRVDAGPDFEKVTHRLLDLLDAGVFVYDGGAPRTKVRDDDPVLQFKLSYRKMLGLASFIGLSDRDRFELSGETLSRWLDQPDQAKSILIDSEDKGRSDGGNGSEGNGESANGDGEGQGVQGEAEASHGPGAPVRRRRGAPPSVQLELALPREATERGIRLAPSLGIMVGHGTLEGWRGREVDTVVIALGFEKRARVSAERLLNVVCPHRVILVRYSEDQGREIAENVAKLGLPTEIVTSTNQITAALGMGERVIVDTSGLSKPYLFVAIRDALTRARQVGVVHTLAEHHYPKNQDLVALGVLANKPVPSDVLARLGDEVLMGEAGPYHLIQVHHEPAGPERWRALLASASPKNDRLLHLLDARACDATRILVPPPTTPRRRIAWAAAELAASATDANVGLVEVDTNDIDGAVRATEEVYGDLYFRSGANVEIGLTGSKVHAVAAAALAAAARVSAAWYVSPQKFDHQRFTEGASETKCFDLTLKA
jgi:hypothetical protein